MKVLLRGERGVGKTALYHLLQGQPLPPAYIPSPEIRSCEITWNYKSSPDVVKVGVRALPGFAVVRVGPGNLPGSLAPCVVVARGSAVVVGALMCARPWAPVCVG